MKDKKHIDRLFRENLKDLEVTPGDSVWNNISAELNNLKNEGHQRKGIPVWWRVAGIAAGLLLLFTVGQFMLNENNSMAPVENIVDSDFDNNGLSEEEKVSTNPELDKIGGDDVLKKLETETTTLSNNSLSNTKQGQDPNLNLIDNDNFTNTNPSKKNKTGDRITTISEKATVVTTAIKTKSENSDTNYLNLKQNNVQISAIDTEKENEILNDNNQLNEVSLAIEDDLKNAVEAQELQPINEEEKLSLTDEIAANENEDDEIDSSEAEFKKWSASSNIAPVYFNTFGNGSSIHPQLNNNSKSGDINMSYGIAASYAISNKLSVRAGINKVNLGYSTNNVIVYNNIESPNNSGLLRNIVTTENAQNLSFISVEEFNFAQVPGPLSNFLKSSIDQKLGFIEIPMELKYTLSDKKIGINVIGGFSTLFLNNNEVYAVDSRKTTLIGKAKNINNTSFSANFGLGLDIKMSDKFNLNLEPVFKYQLNTFNNTSGDFKPYFIGVYSGLSFKF